MTSIDLRRKPQVSLRRGHVSAKKLVNPFSVQPAAEEGLIQDDRAALRPSQMVENKVSGMLKGTFVLVSQLRLMDLIRRGSGS